MPLKDDEDVGKALAALREHRAREWPRLQMLRQYIRNDVTAGIYVPEEATDEYQMLVDQSRFNILAHVVDTVKQSLHVEGFRPTDENGRAISEDNSPVWRQLWQPNRLDSRQGIVHRAALTYGYAYTRVAKADPVPRIQPLSPFRCTTLYRDPEDDEWPLVAMIVERPESLTGLASDDPRQQARTTAINDLMGPETVLLLDDTTVYTLQVDPQASTADAAKIVDRKPHGLGRCPIVRFLDSDHTDGLSPGKVEPLLPIQRQLHQITFGLLITQQFQSFRQRWITGMAQEFDQHGNPISPFNPAVTSIWAAEGVDTKFGEFQQADLGGYLEARKAAMLFATATSAIPAHSLLIGSGVSNISAEALVALDAAHDADVEDHQVLLGESWEQTVRLGGLAMGNDEGRATWEDLSAEVRWKDHRNVSLAQLADALGKLATLLEIPVEGLWARVPGTTQSELDVWKLMRDNAQGDLVGRLQDMIDAPPDPALDPDRPDVPAMSGA